MFGVLFMALGLLAEKGARDDAQYQVNKYYREIAKLELWDGLEKQVYDRLDFRL